eukprot:scaffold69026_cov78-Phaeocystis_antarctica.AAC.3
MVANAAAAVHFTSFSHQRTIGAVMSGAIASGRVTEALKVKAGPRGKAAPKAAPNDIKRCTNKT